MRLIRIGRLELDRLIVLVERTVHRKRLEWFLLWHGRRRHRRRITLVLVAGRILSLRLRLLGIGTIRAARAMVAFRVSHQIRFQLECLGANGAGERPVLRMGNHVVTVQMAIGELALAHFACVHLFLGVLVVDVLFERVQR